MNEFVGWNRDELIAEITRLRNHLKVAREHSQRYESAAEKYWQNEAYERSKQGIYG